ncbi:MAG TPA: glycosyltransferase [Flavobacterium lutivivi]|nr:glycosyltransferase [Flavobacterium lutivivi]
MKILYLTDQVYLHGGAERILIQKLNYWIEFFNYDVTLITTQQKGLKPFIPINNKVKTIDLGIDYQEGVSFFSPKNFSKFNLHYKKLKVEIDKLKPDATFVISQTFVRFLPPFIKNSGKTFFEYHTSYHGFSIGYERLSFLGKLKDNLVKFITKKIEDKYTHVVFLNQIEYDHYKRKNGIIIPNFFIPIAEQRRERKNKMISLGRITHQKGYDFLVDIWKLVDEKISGWELEVYGNGSDFDVIQDRILKSNFKNPMRLLNAINEVDQVLSESSIYLMSSRFETFPMVLLEAMSHGLPTVSFDCISGPRSILTKDEDGFIVPTFDIEAFAKKIVFLVDNPSIREEMSFKAIENVKRFNPRVVMGMWNKYITE